MRPHLLLGEFVEGLAHEFEVRVEKTATLVVGESRYRLGLPPRRDELVGGRDPTGVSSEAGLAACHPCRQLGHHVGRERARDACLGLAGFAVTENSLGRADSRRRVGHVVCEHLVGVGVALGELARDLLYDRAGELDGPSCAVEVRAWRDWV